MYAARVLARWFVLLVAVAACGRVDFGSLRDAAPMRDADDIDMPEGCALYFKMDEPAWTGAAGEVRDSCGTNPGTAVNGITTAEDPVRGRVGMFSHETGCIEVPDAPSLHATTALTISAWIKPAMLSPSGFGIVSKRIDYTKSTEYSVFVWAANNGMGSTNQLYVDIDTENDRNSDPTTTLVDGAWRQVTVVYDGSQPMPARVRYYVDGTFTFAAPETSSSIAVPPAEPNLAVGCLPLNAPAQSFIGALDDVVIWRRALAASEVADWHTATHR